MPDSLNYQCRLICLFAVLPGLAVSALPVQSQEKPDSVLKPAVTASNDGNETLRFAFEGMPWRDVIKWFAETSGLALHIGDVPTGSLTYSDPNEFTRDEALDRLNLFLLPQGFTLVRSGGLLSVINLGDSRSLQQLDTLARLITVQQLEEPNDHDVVKCIFPLGEISAEDAIEELSSLKLMLTPAIFNRTNQLMVTDTVTHFSRAD